MHVRATPSDLLDGYDFCILTSQHTHLHRLQQQCCQSNNSGDSSATTADVVSAGKMNDLDLNWCAMLSIWIEDRRHLHPLRYPLTENFLLQWKNNNDYNDNNSVHLTDISRLQYLSNMWF